MNDKLNVREDNLNLFDFRDRAKTQTNRAEFNYANNSSVNLGREGEFSRRTNINPNGDFTRNYSLNNDIGVNDRLSRQNPYASRMDERVSSVDDFDDYYEQNPYFKREESTYSSARNTGTAMNDDYYSQNPYYAQANREEVQEKPVVKSRFENLTKEKFIPSRMDEAREEKDDFFDFRSETRSNAVSNITALAESSSTFKFVNEDVDDFALMPRIESKKKAGIKNPSLKVCIAVYVLIVAIIAAMILTNVFIGKTAEASNLIEPSYNSDAVNYGVVDGQVVQLEQSTRNFQYEVAEETNWFDKLCSAIDNLSK